MPKQRSVAAHPAKSTWTLGPLHPNDSSIARVAAFSTSGDGHVLTVVRLSPAASAESARTRRACGVDDRRYPSRYASRASSGSHSPNRCAETASNGRPVFASRIAFSKNSHNGFRALIELGNILPKCATAHSHDDHLPSTYSRYQSCKLSLVKASLNNREQASAACGMQPRRSPRA
jgi:hypothetical protein